MKLDNDDTESTHDSSTDSRSKSSLRPLASEDSLWNSHSSDCHLGDHDDDDNWGFFDQVPKRNRSVALHSMASTGTLTSNGSSHANILSSNSNSNRSPKSDRRGSISSHTSPRRSPRPGCLRKSSDKQDISKVQDRVGEIASLPLSTATASGHAPENERGQGNNGRRLSGDRGKSKGGPPKDGQGLYYQPSKAFLHNSNIHQPAKKPQRIRARSKGPVLRRKSPGESQMKSQSLQPGRTTSRDASSGASKRSKSCEPHDGICSVHGRSKSCDRQCGTTKKKSSRSASRSREKPSSKDSNASFHESWPQPQQKRNKEIERQKQQHRETEKIERKKLTSKTKTFPSHKKKETKEGKDKGDNDINDVITFFDDMVTMKRDNPTTRPSTHPGRSMTKSSSERCVSRSKSPASSSVGVSSAHGAPNGLENPLLDPSNKRRQRRSSAPAKAVEAFQQYRNSIGASEFEDFDEPAPAQPEPPAPEKVMLDVSELAALEIIRLGKDNSLKLDLFDLMKYLKREQLKKNTAVGKDR
jgi:hypothetical protein